MRRSDLATSTAITVLATIILAAMAYEAASGGLHLRRQASPRAVVATPTASAVAPVTPSPIPKTAPAPAPSPAPLPAVLGQPVIGLDFVDGTHGWALLTGCAQQPSSGRCAYSTASTADGGVTWSRPTQVGATFAVTDGDAPRSVRFLNLVDGFVWGGEAAFVTHDGGHSWLKAGFQAASINSFAFNGDEVWAVAYPCAKGTLCAFQVFSSVDDGRSWSSPHELPATFSPDIAIAFASGAVLSDIPLGNMEITTDGGATWSAIPSRCTSNSFRGEVSTPDGHELWQVCSGYPPQSGGSGAQTLFVSEDGGRTWSARHGFPQSVMWNVVSPRPRVAFVSTAGGTLVTQDAGNTWQQLSPGSLDLGEIHFRGTTWGWGLDTSRGLWITYDGGDHWASATQIPSTLS